MGWALRPKRRDDATRIIIGKRLAVGHGGSLRQRSKRMFEHVAIRGLYSTEGRIEHVCGACVGSERGDGPHDIGALAELRPVESERLEQRLVLRK